MASMGATALHLSDRYLWLAPSPPWRIEGGPGTDMALSAEHYEATGVEVYWAYADHQGTVTDIVSGAGNYEARRYDAFGNVVELGRGLVRIHGFLS